jgi:hypothetical protein
MPPATVLAGDRRRTVIFHVGGHDKGALTARREHWCGEMDLERRWPRHGSPIVANLGGVRQLITITQGKLVGVDAASGGPLGAAFCEPQLHQLDYAVLHGRR